MFEFFDLQVSSSFQTSSLIYTHQVLNCSFSSSLDQISSYYCLRSLIPASISFRVFFKEMIFSFKEIIVLSTPSYSCSILNFSFLSLSISSSNSQIVFISFSISLSRIDSSDSKFSFQVFISIADFSNSSF